MHKLVIFMLVIYLLACQCACSVQGVQFKAKGEMSTSIGIGNT